MANPGDLEWDEEVARRLAELKAAMTERPAPKDWRAKMGVIGADHAAAIGYVAVHWTLAQTWQAQIIQLMLGIVSDAGDAITAELSEQQRTEIIRTLLVRARHQEWLDEWDEIVRFATPLRNLRNDVIHSQWHANAGGEHSFYRLRAKGKLVIRSEKISAEQINELSERILQLVNKLIDFFYLLHEFGGSGVATVTPEGPPLVPGQGREARAQAQGRARKQARRGADRADSRKPEEGPSSS